MASPLSQGLFQRAILESGECQDTLNEDIRTPIKYNFIDTTGEASGERLARDLGVSNALDALRSLRQVPADEILRAWKNDPGLHFDAIVDGWIVPKQPNQIFAEEKQLHIPILVGSNADEATVFGHNDLKTADDYRRHLQQDTGQYWKKEFQLYPVSSNLDVPTRSVRLESDEFACGAYSLARAMTKAGEKSYLYYFTYVDPGERLRLGAHHGEELFFLSDSFPADWEHTNEDKHLGELLSGYWAEFARTGDPNFDDLPQWPAFDSHSADYFEIGPNIGSHPVSKRIRDLETIMRRITAEQRACQVVRLPRATHRYRSIRDPLTALRMRLRELAQARIRYGYRKLRVLLIREGWQVGKKRVYRLYREERLGLQRRPASGRRSRSA